MPKRVMWVALCLLWCHPASAQEKGNANLGAQAREILEKYCVECHNSPEYKFLDFKYLRETGTTADGWVAPGKPDTSPIYREMILGLDDKGVGMPPKKKRNRPSPAEVEVVKAWIAAGCPDPADAVAVSRRSPISNEGMLRAMKADLEAAELEDRPYLRYFTLTHLHNADAKRVSDEQLQLYRAALCEAVNALSWKSRIVQPRPIDTDRTIFAIDLRDFDWDRKGVWGRMLSYYPYGLSFANAPGALPSLEKFISEETDTQMPYVRADWFVVNATRPPLYHHFLNLPTNATELEKRLGVDVGDNFRRNRLVRGGMKNSGVSKQHRMVERHDALYGSYWKSYDFRQGKNRADGGQRADLFKYPLGPATFADGYRNPFALRAGFEHDGGEIIFNLPNGLQAYLLVDGKDQRIDEGPIDVVSDAEEVAGTPVIVNGLSCMSCHKAGMKRFTDVVRDETPLNNKELRKVELLYPLPVRMNALLDEDSERFRHAMEKAVGKYLPAGKVANKDAVAPVGWAAKKHLEVLDLAAAAGELGVKPDTVRFKLGEQGLKDLNLGGFAKEGGQVKREDWEAGFPSAAQKLAEKLRIGNPILVPRQ